MSIWFKFLSRHGDAFRELVWSLYPNFYPSVSELNEVFSIYSIEASACPNVAWSDLKLLAFLSSVAFFVFLGRSRSVDRSGWLLIHLTLNTLGQR